ncbi:hypothetical protein DRO35_02040 [Candidatus Bathyarchaeota archaeon]|nr:MAG: hypothetical protein DRO35_02040 [Candidatus Bathyarchaeota archaeon]
MRGGRIIVRVQPVDFAPLGIGVGKALMAEEAWIHGPEKPRDVERERERPSKPVDLETLRRRYDFIEVLPPRNVSSSEDVDRLPRNVSAFLVREFNFNYGLLGELCKLNRPILVYWDRFGYAWHGRLIREYAEEAGSVCFVPFGAEDVERIIRVLRAIAFLRSLKILYVGDVPSHSVRCASYDFADLQSRFGVRFQQISMKEYERTVETADRDKSMHVAEKWSENADILDEREGRLMEYANIYIGLKNLLQKYDANGITMDCAFLRSVDLVPCYSFAHLIDEGIPSGCEGDTSAIISMAILMGLSGEAALMGNLFANTTHRDIENNVIVINHDVVPLSMGAKDARAKLRDFHATGKGLTGYIELDRGRKVTIMGMDRNARRLWCTCGEIVWTEDTVHCRTSIGVKVKDAKRVGREGFGHHQAMTYGDWVEEIEMLGRILKLDVHTI